MDDTLECLSLTGKNSGASSVGGIMAGTRSRDVCPQKKQARGVNVGAWSSDRTVGGGGGS